MRADLLPLLPGLLLALVLAGAGPCGGGDPPAPPAPAAPQEETTPEEPVPPVERLRAKVVAVHPHDPDAFTQGLVWHDGFLWESTGQHGRSEVRQVELETGRVVRRAPLGPGYFGEGLARVEERLVQLTWQEGTAFYWSLPGLEPAGERGYDGEGWGLCHDGRRLVMSDGSSYLTFRDPDSFDELRRLRVELDGLPLANLNELECVDGFVYANVWQAEWLVKIDPETGRVVARLDATGLLSAEERVGTDVMNGVAYRPETGTFLLTGKYWPKLFEVAWEP